jgi:hypothetical protein
MRRRSWVLGSAGGAAVIVLLALGAIRPAAAPAPSASRPGAIAGVPTPSAGRTGDPATALPSTALAEPTGAVPGASAGGGSSPSTTLPGPTPGPTVAPTASLPGPTPRPTAAPTPARSATPSPTGTPGPTPGPIPPLSACSIFPSTNVWNRRVDALPVAANSDALIASIGLGSSLHPDFSNAGGYGIPYNLVGSSTQRWSVAFQYADESDPGPYPIPASPEIEGGSDRHLLAIDTDACVLYELFAASKTTTGWQAGSGAIWDLGSNALRPDGWTSADAAGLPILPGLVRYSEVAAGAIRHAIRFTAPSTCSGYIYPATHEAGSGSCSTKPPMGLRVRLKASVDISGFGPQSRVILRALQEYGMLLADNGSAWYITGAPDSHWNDDELHGLGGIKGSDFEVVDTSGFVNG